MGIIGFTRLTYLVKSVRKIYSLFSILITSILLLFRYISILLFLYFLKDFHYIKISIYNFIINLSILKLELIKSMKSPSNYQLGTLNEEENNF